MTHAFGVTSVSAQATRVSRPICRHLGGALNIAVHPTRLRSHPSQAGSFLATATFFNVTYFGKPSLP